MSILSSTGFLGKLWAGIKSLFVKAEEVLLPEAISITEDVNTAIKSGTVADVVNAISPSMGGIPAKLLTAAQVLVPKILAAELGLQALNSGATPEDAAAWAQSAIAAFASKDFTAQSKVWTNLAASLVILFDDGKTTNKTWIDWANTADQAFQKIQAAVVSAQTAIAPAPAATAAAA
jgi:hypothetical protein